MKSQEFPNLGSSPFHPSPRPPRHPRHWDLHPELPLHGPGQAPHLEGVEAQAPQRVVRPKRRRDGQLQQQLLEAVA